MTIDRQTGISDDEDNRNQDVFLQHLFIAFFPLRFVRHLLFDSQLFSVQLFLVNTFPLFMRAALLHFAWDLHFKLYPL